MKSDPTHYINRELSWLEFNQRVLNQAQYAKVPVMERLKFLAITASNMDEFFMVRVGGLQLQEAQQIQAPDPSGATVTEQLEAIYSRVDKIISDQYECFLSSIEPILKSEGIIRVESARANALHKDSLQRFFEQEIYPVISPMDLDPDAPFPLLSNLGFYLCVRMASGEQDMPHRFAFIPIGKTLPRLIKIPGERGAYAYALIEDVITCFIEQYYPGKRVEECTAFRVTRNADVSVREDSASDLILGMEEVLSSRRSADFVRLEIDAKVSEATFDFLSKKLMLEPRDIFKIPGPLDLSALMSITEIEGFPNLRDTVWPPQRSPQIDSTKSMFENMAASDLLLCHPYESFEPVVRLIEEAANDPDVLAIKQTLYRTSRKSLETCCRAWEVRYRRGGAQGPFRRGPKHGLGSRAGTLWRSSRLRCAGIKDPRENLYSRKARGRWDRPVCPFWYGQLQRVNRQNVQRYQLSDMQRIAWKRCFGVLQRNHRLQPASTL
jgi:polyphosphate kinase